MLISFSQNFGEWCLVITRQRVFYSQLLHQLLFVGCYLETLVHFPPGYQLVICMQSSLQSVTLCFSVIFLSVYFYRWHAIRRPKLWQVEKESSYQKVNSLWPLLYIFYYLAMFQFLYFM